MEMNAVREVAANMGGSLGSSINISTNAGAQLASDLGIRTVDQDERLAVMFWVEFRLLEPMAVADKIIPRNAVVVGTAKIQGERLDIEITRSEERRVGKEC